MRESIQNKYELCEKLAAGGTSEVWLARQRGAGDAFRLVVIKRVHPSLAQDPKFVGMLLDEARLATELNNPNIAQVYDSSDDERGPFLAIELVVGESLEAVVGRAHLSPSRLIPLPLTVYIIHEICNALHHAHSRTDPLGRPLRVVHRDVSPANVLLSYRGEVKVIDFGVAKATTQAHKTQLGMVKGRFRYMSPEQCQSAPVDARSDIFALGVLMWELLTGRQLYDQPDEVKIIDAIVSAPVPLPSSVNSAVPPVFDGIVMGMLAKNPQHRIQNCRDIQEQLAPLATTMQLREPDKELSRLLQKLFPDRLKEWEVIISRATENADAPTNVYAEPGKRPGSDAPTKLFGLGVEQKDEPANIFDRYVPPFNDEATSRARPSAMSRQDISTLAQLASFGDDLTAEISRKDIQPVHGPSIPPLPVSREAATLQVPRAASFADAFVEERTLSRRFASWIEGLRSHPTETAPRVLPDDMRVSGLRPRPNELPPEDGTPPKLVLEPDGDEFDFNFNVCKLDNMLDGNNRLLSQPPDASAPAIRAQRRVVEVARTRGETVYAFNIIRGPMSVYAPDDASFKIAFVAGGCQVSVSQGATCHVSHLNGDGGVTKRHIYGPGETKLAVGELAEIEANSFTHRVRLVQPPLLPRIEPEPGRLQRMAAFAAVALVIHLAGVLVAKGTDRAIYATSDALQLRAKTSPNLDTWSRVAPERPASAQPAPSPMATAIDNPPPAQQPTTKSVVGPTADLDIEVPDLQPVHVRERTPLVKAKTRAKIRKPLALAGAPRISGDVARGAVLKELGRHQKQIQACYDRALAKDPRLAGKAVFEWTIKANGGVGGAQVRAGAPRSPVLSSCVLSVIRTMQFQKPKRGAVAVMYPVVFR